MNQPLYGSMSTELLCQPVNHGEGNCRRVFSYAQLKEWDRALEPIRQSLYAPDGPGYFRIPEYVDDQTVRQLVEFWTEHDPSATHERFLSRQSLHIRCPNYVQGPTAAGDIQYYNFYWNPPADETTIAVAHQIELIRSWVQQRQYCHELHPVAQTSTIAGQHSSYRISINRQGERIVPPHRDWTHFPAPDPRRLQATLVLSSKGQDYSGKGFSLHDHQDREQVLGEDIAAEPGDLILWPYTNLHAVSQIHTQPGQIGFVRMTHPNVHIYGPRSKRREFYWQVKTGRRFRRFTTFLLTQVRPVFRRLRGLSPQPDVSTKNMKYDDLEFPHW